MISTAGPELEMGAELEMGPEEMGWKWDFGDGKIGFGVEWRDLSRIKWASS